MTDTGTLLRVHPVITVDELEHQLDAAVVVDVRWALLTKADRAAYDAGHIPGAVFADLEADLSGPVGDGTRGRHPLPDPAHLQATLRRWGISTDTLVIAYDALDSTAAARLWWLLRWAGHDQVQVLEGGFQAWVTAGLPQATTYEPPPAGDVVVTPRTDLTIDAPEAASWPAHGVLIDARAEARYLGLTEPVDPVAGHIPGAVTLPTTGHVDADGRFRTETFPGLQGADVAAYCGSGVTAAHTVLALELAGISAKLYAGSWSEWVSDPSRPIETDTAHFLP